jgi:hypothetical protein
MTFCGGPTDDAARYVATVSGALPLLPTSKNHRHHQQQQQQKKQMTKC